MIRFDRATPVAGKGMWIWEMARTFGGNPSAIVREAVRHGISHLYVRAGSGWTNGLDTLAESARLIPYAHRAGIDVIAWYFPYFNDIRGDVRRCWRTMQLPFDGLALDIEPTGGSALSWTTARSFSSLLRRALPSSFLIEVPPRPTADTKHTFPYAWTAPYYDAIAPMVYWGGNDPAATVRSAIAYLRQFGKPVVPIGQAYDMGPEGGPDGNPPPYETWAFMREAKALGAPGVSFWDWQEVSRPELHAIQKFDY